MRSITVTCDDCGRNLTTSGNAYRLLLTSEKVPSVGQAVFTSHVEPIIPQDSHFCGTGCLASWMDKDLGHNRAEVCGFDIVTRTVTFRFDSMLSVAIGDKCSVRSKNKLKTSL